MKLVTALIKPAKLDEVRDKLSAAGTHGMTVTDVRGFGRQKGHSETYRGAEYTIDFNPKVKVEVAIDEPLVDEVVDIICQAAQTGNVGDGKIFVTPIEKAVRIRTREVGVEAL